MPRAVRILLPNIISLVVIFITVDGVVCNFSRSLASFTSQSPSLNFWRLCFTDWTVRSAWPLELGWNGAVKIFFIQFFFRKSCTSFDLKEVLLSDTIYCGSPKVANSFVNSDIIWFESVDGTCRTSVHFIVGSTIIKKFCFWKGPAKSMWSLVHGCSGTSQFRVGALGGLCLISWHESLEIIRSSICLSIPYQQTWDLAKALVATIPGLQKQVLFLRWICLKVWTSFFLKG